MVRFLVLRSAIAYLSVSVYHEFVGNGIRIRDITFSKQCSSISGIFYRKICGRFEFKPIAAECYLIQFRNYKFHFFEVDLSLLSQPQVPI